MLPIFDSADVAKARQDRIPIVALESTIITNGMPWPGNLDMARQVEADIRNGGAIPATIAVLDGQIRIGLTGAELERLARMKDALKLSRADLAYAVAQGRSGGTTVTATMICANLAGIEVFATGGIGGVHRGAADSFDISADLEELARTPVTVVAAGAKAILDLPKTFERLETLGVPVIAYGQDMIPAFWSRSSGIPAPMRLDTAADIANAHRMRATLRLGGGQLVANPVPADAEIPLQTLAPLIDQALTEAVKKGITGKSVTPFLLSRILHLTRGKALAANIALVRNNARLAAEIAKALA